MDRWSRLLLILAFVAIAIWRLVRYMRLGLAARRTTLGVAGGWFPPTAEQPSVDANAPPPDATQSSFLTRQTELVVAVVAWLAANALIWFALFGLPLLENVPPVPRGVAGIFANFYVIPWAQNIGRRCRTDTKMRMTSLFVFGGIALPLSIVGLYLL